MQDPTRGRAPCAYPGKNADNGYRCGCRCDRCRAGKSDARRRSEMRAAGLIVIPCRCGAPIPRGNSKFCSEACRHRANGYMPVESKLFTCAAIDCHNLCRSSRRGACFCSNACKVAATAARRGRPSGARTPHWLMSRLTLGPKLRSWPMFGPTTAPVASVDRPCMDCGDMMVGVHPARKRCVECARVHNIGKVMGLYEAAYSTGRVRQAMRWRYELVGYLRERDGDKCALCSKRMRFDVTTGPRGDSDRGATVDHILPRSLDGTNDLANLQLAHWACNRAKNNRGAAEQLRLVG